MKLIYVYVEDFPPFKDQEFHFVSDYRCSYRKGCLAINRRQVLPTHFFSPKDELFVSALVGPNGAGKTSVIRLLQSLVFVYHGCKYIALVEAKGNLVVYYNLDEKLKVETSGCSISDKDILDEKAQRSSYRQGDKLGECMPIAYFSPHYSISAPVSHVQDGVFTDISTTGLLNKAALEVRGKNISVEDKFRADEIVRELRFLREAQFKEPRPKRILARPKTWQLRENVEFLAYIVADEEGRRERIKGGFANPALNLTDVELKRLKFIVSFIGTPEKDPFLQMAKCVIASLWYSKSGYYSDRFRKNPLLKDTLDFMRKKRAWSREGIVKFFKRQSCNPEWESLSQSIQVLASLRVVGDDLEVSDIKDIEHAVELVELVCRGSSIATFCDFAYDPPLSAGEHSRLVLYSRLFEFFEDRRALEADYDGTDISRPYANHWQSGWLVFLDEAEITLHPAWQQSLVSDLLESFSSSFPGFNVHFILATHSPVLLSDVPKGNVVILDRNHQVQSIERLKNTFGASIFNLYRHGFGLTDGLWGKFADCKMRDAFLIADGHANDGKDNQLLLNIIGDEFIADYLKSSVCRRVSDEAEWERLIDETPDA